MVGPEEPPPRTPEGQRAVRAADDEESPGATSTPGEDIALGERAARESANIEPMTAPPEVGRLADDITQEEIDQQVRVAAASHTRLPACDPDTQLTSRAHLLVSVCR